MKTIGIFSDRHGYINPKLFNFFEPCDELWHAGDWGSVACFDEVRNFKPVKTVYGNIDDNHLKLLMPEVNTFICEGLNICILHIGGYPGKYSVKFKEILNSHKPDLMICGHSHILKVINDKQNNLLHINPGAAGIHGFHKKSTAIRLKINNKNIQSLEVWETER